MDKASFFEKVYDIVRLIPAGRVTSYGAIAAYLGTKGSSRMVGYAMHGAGNVFPPVPAHRVVNSKGLLTGKQHFETPELMQQLLKSEGVIVEQDQIINFKDIFWDPVVEL